MKHLNSSLRFSTTSAIVLFLAGCAASPDAAHPRTITVIGHGVIKAAPDTFVLSAGVEHQDADLDKARNQVAEATRRMMQVAKSFPIDEKRTHTTRFNVEPQYQRDTSELKGYRISQNMQICLHDLTRADELTWEMLRAGATNTYIEFQAAQKEEELFAQARLEALRDARKQAESLAAVLGERVGPALDIGRPTDSSGGSAYLFQSQSARGTDEEVKDTQQLELMAPTELEVSGSIYVRFAVVPSSGH